MSAEIYQATVVTGSDPSGQGRIKVVIPQVTGTAGVWAFPTGRSPAQPASGSAVWVHFDAGDPARPVYHAAAGFGSWNALAPGSVGANWSVHTAQYRVGPSGMVQYRGSVAKSVSPTTAGETVCTMNAALWPSAAGPSLSWPVAYVPGSGAMGVASVTLSAVGVLALNAGALTFTGGSLLVDLTPLAYSTV